MRRAIILSALFAGCVAALGCNKFITGRCDCTHDPAGAVVTPAYNPYPTVSTAPAAAAGGIPSGAPDTLPKVEAPKTDGK